ncbi:MAG: AAA family ATPase, partial [Planctomycetota bacterium]
IPRSRVSRRIEEQHADQNRSFEGATLVIGSTNVWEMLNAALETTRRLVDEVLAPMKLAFVDKDEIIDLLGVAVVARENLFLHGPPGTAKSALVRSLAARIGGRSFEYLLTRFTEPSEVFGPFDIRRLREGDLVTNTEGMLPEAHFVFLDELLNANSSILNGLLGVLNERVLRRGREVMRLPMITAVGASNHLPDDEALGALFDRFLLRVRCENVTESALERVLDAGWSLEAAQAESGSVLDVDALFQLGEALAHVNLDAVRAPLAELVRAIRRTGIGLSDRRAVKMQRTVAASALLAGRGEARTSDLWVFRYAWESEEQREILASVVAAALSDVSREEAHPRAMDPGPADAEAIGSELSALRASHEAGATPTTEVLDRCQHLAARLQWVAGVPEREHLLRELEALREELGSA